MNNDTLFDLDEVPPQGGTDPDDRDLWWANAWAAVQARAALPGPFEIYEAAKAAGIVTAPHPNLWGTLTSNLRKQGVIVHYSYARGGRATVRGSAVALWVGAAFAKGGAA